MAAVLVSFSSFLQVFTLQLPLSFFYCLYFHTVRIILTFRYSPSVRVPCILSRKSFLQSIVHWYFVLTE